jgi:hypothetical protein
LASTVTTLPSGMALLNATWQMLLTLHVLLQYLPRDPFANNSPKKIIQRVCFTW